MHSLAWRRSILLPVVLSVAALAPVLMACHRDTGSTQLTSAAASASPSAASRRAPIPDTDITQAIRRHMQEDQALRSEQVQVGVSDGICTLSGSVGNLLAKERALRVAESIRGVRSVIDNVDVAPVARTDQQIESDVTRELKRDVATRPYAVGATAKDGKVTLSGSADSWQQKTLFADVAKTVRGVKAIDSQISVHYATERSDAEIAADVKHRVANDVWLDGSAIGVTVTGHTVSVSGVVRSVAEKSRARSDAWTLGVDRVDDSGLVVDWLAHDDQRRTIDYAFRTDDAIAQAVRDAFRLDARLKTLEPKVAVQGGVVTLSGTVDSPMARRAAANDAKDTLGVWSVRDQTLVQPAGRPTDADIERGVKRALAEDLLLPDASSIHPSTAKGKVVLEGKVTSGFARFDAIADAASIPGVAEVVDDLSVTRSPAELKANIEDRLFWDPMVERDRVAVAVAPDGVATLTGTLDSWSEVRAATDDALWGGAKRVVNELALKKRATH
ncbi:hypothetical protein BH11MYX4_BH11MYX4_00970 [soil metagenome]